MNKPIPNQPSEQTPPELYDEWEHTDIPYEDEEDNATDAAWTEPDFGGFTSQEIAQLLTALDDDTFHLES